MTTNHMRVSHIINHIKGHASPTRVWFNEDHILCCGYDYPDGEGWQPIGTYQAAGFQEHFLIEDLRYAETLT